MAEQTLVSVIMNCFNGENYLREAIDSVLAQTYQNWELIFWDNQSTDASAQLVKGYNDPRIRYFYATKHTLLYEARNLAIEQSKGEFLAFLDVDDWWEANKMEKQVHTLNDPEVGLVCSNYEVHHTLFGYSHQAWKKPMPSGYIIKDLLNFYHIGLLTIMLRRENYNLLGGFDSRFHIIGDFDISLRLAEKWKVVSDAYVLAHYRLHEENETDKNQSLQINELKIWLKEAMKRDQIASETGLKNFAKQIDFLNGQHALIRGNFVEFLHELKNLFPSTLFMKLLIKACLPDTWFNLLRKWRYQSYLKINTLFC